MGKYLDLFLIKAIAGVSSIRIPVRSARKDERAFQKLFCELS